MPMQIKETTVLEKQLKKDKTRIKKYESIIKKCAKGIKDITLLLREVNQVAIPAEKESAAEMFN